MNPETLKKIIDLFTSISKVHADMEYVRIQNSVNGIRLFSYADAHICNVFIPNETTESDCMVHYTQKDYLTALYKQYKKTEVPLGEFIEHTVEYTQPQVGVDNLMSSTNTAQKPASFTIDFKALERVYKSMKKSSNNIRIDVTEGKTPLLVSNEEGDISILSKIII